MNSTAYLGGCLCGRIRYRIRTEPLDAGYCHCRICQRAGGAPVVPWATFPVESLELTHGDLKTYQSSPAAVRQFCGDCGTPICFRSAENATVVDVTLASLDDPSALRPQYHIWTMSQVAWLQIADELPRYADRGPDTRV